mgnify:FL=1
MSQWKENLIKQSKSGRDFSLRDLQSCFTSKADADEFAQMIRQNRHKPLREFIQTANDWQAFVPPALLSSIAMYGLVDELPTNLVTVVPESRDGVTKRFLWKSEGIEDYGEGEPFRETYIEGATSSIRWRKPGAKISETRESAMDLPLSVMQNNFELTANEFKVREWKHFTHELHNGTSNEFDARATLKNGEPFDLFWRDTFDNAFEPNDTDPYGGEVLATWTDIKDARAKMLRRERDAARPTVCICNASTEANLADTLGVNNAAFLGGSDTFFRTGSLPNIYGLQFVIVPDAFHGYFSNNTLRKNTQFIQTNDVFLVAGNNGPTVMRHTREPLSTESWQIFDGQKSAMNIWERYEYSTYRHTNLMRIALPIPSDEYGVALE